MSMVEMDETRQEGWYFRLLNDSAALKGEEIPWSIYNINLMRIGGLELGRARLERSCTWMMVRRLASRRIKDGICSCQ